MESENRMREEKQERRGKRKEEGGKAGEMKLERWREKEKPGGRRRGRWRGLKMMIHPDPSECCHVPPSR